MKDRRNREKGNCTEMFSQQVARGGRRIGQMARGGQHPSLAALRGAAQRRCYAEAAQGEFSCALLSSLRVNDMRRARRRRSC